MNRLRETARIPDMIYVSFLSLIEYRIMRYNVIAAANAGPACIS